MGCREIATLKMVGGGGFWRHMNGTSTVPVTCMGSQIVLEHLGRDVSVPHLLHLQWRPQHGRARRTGDDAPRTVEVLLAKDHHRRVPDTVQLTTYQKEKMKIGRFHPEHEKKLGRFRQK